MRPSRLRAVSAAVLPFVFLAACSSAKTNTPANALDEITVGGTNTTPTMTFKTKPLSVKVTTAKVVTAGKGARLAKDSLITFNYSVFNGKDGKQVETNYGKKPVGIDLSSALPGLVKGLSGQQVGARVLIAIPPADAFQGAAQPGVGAADTIFFIVDVLSLSSPLKTAAGDPVKPPAGLPTVKVDGKGVPVVTVPKTPPSTKLVVQVLIKGNGQTVKNGESLTAAYTGLVYGTGKVFDSSYTSGNLLRKPVGVGQLVPGFDKGIVGQTVGSRVLLVLPPAEGYGTAGNAQAGIKGTDTIVFVVDILAAI